jgi:hypothetical protein
MNEAKDNPKSKKKRFRIQINGKFNSIVVLMKINKKTSLQQFVRLSETEIQDLLHTSQVNLG